METALSILSLIATFTAASWADAQSTPGRCANARVLIALGLGAGLSAHEIGEIRISDIEADDLGVQLRVGGIRSRTVPVLDNWAEALAECRASLTPGFFAFRENHTENYANLISNFVARNRVPGVKPQTQRMRSTWVVHHLDCGTPVALLLGAAGVASLEAFTRYLPFVRATDEKTSRELLSGRVQSAQAQT